MSSLDLPPRRAEEETDAAAVFPQPAWARQLEENTSHNPGIRLIQRLQSFTSTFDRAFVGLTFVDLAASGFMLATAKRRGGCRD
jgi:hypothetical protein